MLFRSVWSDGSLERDQIVAEVRTAIFDWTLKWVGVPLSATNEKDPGMIQFLDDKAIGIQKDTGLPDGWNIY